MHMSIWRIHLEIFFRKLEWLQFQDWQASFQQEKVGLKIYILSFNAIILISEFIYMNSLSTVYSKSPTYETSSCKLSEMRTCIRMSNHVS